MTADFLAAYANMLQYSSSAAKTPDVANPHQTLLREFKLPIG